MRTWTYWLMGPLTVGLALTLSLLAPPAAQAQLNYEVPQATDWVSPFPLYHNRPEMGGFYLHGEYVMYRQTNPMGTQPVAVEGFFDADGSVTGFPGRFVGSGKVALSADDVSGPSTYQPGFRVGAGWRFLDGSVLDVDWMHLLKSQYPAVATLARPNFNVGRFAANSFLTAPVFNFPTEFAGPPNDLSIGNPGATFGIWNAADIMSIEFTQRTEQFQATYRVPIFETECWRTYGLVGPRFFWIWERFKWRTVDLDNQGVAIPAYVANYTNIVSNRMYGGHIGIGNEWYVGHGFAVSLDVGAALFMDIVKERARYETGDKFGPQVKRSRTEYAIVPELTGGVNVWWYPIDGVQVRFGYDVMTFFNTVANRDPISFNYGGLDPNWNRVFRAFDGFNFGVGLIF